jgi:proline dehydrogenase
MAPASRHVNRALRTVILGAADDEHVQSLVRKYGMRMGAARFVAGETLDDCVAVLRRLNERGLHANTTILGESVTDAAEAVALTAEYEGILERLGAEDLRCNIAVKLTQLGLLVGEELAFESIARLVDRAAKLDNFVRIDMEQSEHVDATLRIYRRLRESGRDAVGCVLQAYLYRTQGDLEDLLSLRPNIRIVKGAYLEPSSIAYPNKADVDTNYAQLVERALAGGAYAAVATHDEALIEHTLRFVGEQDVPRDGFEFQMLYGVRPSRQIELVNAGYKVLVATPYGRDWYPYLMRRMAERPANLTFVLRNAVRR